MSNGITQRVTNKMIFEEIGGIRGEMKNMNEKLIPVCTKMELLPKQVGKNTAFRLKTTGALKIIGILLAVSGVLLKIFKVI